MHNVKHWTDRYAQAKWSFFNTQTAEKKCLTKWAVFQERHPSQKEIQQWLMLLTQNWGIVCGEISNLVVFDVDTKNGGDPAPFLNKNLYEVRTPSGGYHFYTLYDPLLKSTRHKKDPKSGILKAVDVQSNGSIVFAPPSKFPNGAYTLVHDTPITPLPDDLLTQVLEELEPEKENTEYTPFTPIARPEMGRPGDIFNALASWDDVLLPHGWTRVGRPRSSGVQFWRRPGKKEGISASTNWKGYDLFFPYTTSVENLLQRKGYTRFHLYAVLNHKGNFAQAARALVVENYRIANKLI